MRVLLTSQLGEGHWRPLAGLARALQAAGHEVAFASTPACCATISRHGFACFPVGVDDDRVERDGRDAAPDGLDPAADVWRYVFAGLRVEQMLPGMLDVVREWGPQLVVREISEFSGALAAEAQGIPHAALQISAWRPYLHDVIAPALDAYREELSLPSSEITELLYRHLLLSPIPPGYRDAARPFPPATYPMHVPGYDLQPGAELPDWLTSERACPRIFATLGTAYNDFPEIFRMIVAAVAERDIELVLATGREPATFGLGAMPSNVRLLSYLPQSLAFPRCDLVISHGGFGTVQAALRHGLPQILLPIAADQPDNAALCASHGVAVTLAPDERSEASLESTLDAVLADPVMRRRAEAWRWAIESLPGPADVVGRLEAVVDGDA